MRTDHVELALIAAGLVIMVAAALSLAITEAPGAEQRDAPTTRFYDSRGNALGSATTYGTETKFYDARGNRTGTAQSK